MRKNIMDTHVCVYNEGLNYLCLLFERTET